jgi:hypothetical protein
VALARRQIRCAPSLRAPRHDADRGETDGADHIVGVYDFTATVPSGAGRYAVKIRTGNPVWFTEAPMDKGPGLSYQ